MGWTFYNATGQQLQTSATVLATQAEMETGTALTSFVTPGRTQNHPGVAKVTCVISATGTLNSGSYNTASITDTGTGDRIVVFDVDFADILYTGTALQQWNQDGNGNANFWIDMETAATGSMVLQAYQDGTLVDQQHCHNFFGNQ